MESGEESQEMSLGEPAKLCNASVDIIQKIRSPYDYNSNHLPRRGKSSGFSRCWGAEGWNNPHGSHTVFTFPDSYTISTNLSPFLAFMYPTIPFTCA